MAPLSGLGTRISCAQARVIDATMHQQVWAVRPSLPKPRHEQCTPYWKQGPPVVPFYTFFGEATKLDYRIKGTHILTSLLEDLVYQGGGERVESRF